MAPYLWGRARHEFHNVLYGTVSRSVTYSAINPYGTPVPIAIRSVLCFARMPDQPTWIHRLPEILAWLESDEAPPFLHRGLIEAGFRLRRRQALRLMENAGGYQAGRTYLIDRRQLAQFLRERDSRVVDRAAHRKLRLEDQIDESRRQVEARRLRVRVDPGLENSGAASLPAGIESVAHDRIEIRFFGAEDLLSKVASLAAFAVNEPARFRQTFEPAANPVTESIP